MPALKLLSRFMAWHWMPFFALTGGSLAFVGIVVLAVPNRLEGNATAGPSFASPAFPQGPQGAGNDALNTAAQRPSPAVHAEFGNPRSNGFTQRLSGRVSHLTNPALGPMHEPSSGETGGQPANDPMATPSLNRRLPVGVHRAQLAPTGPGEPSE